MLEAIILNGDHTLVCDLPHDPLELQNKLNSIGISLTADRLPLADEDGAMIRVKLFASTPEEAHLLSLLTPERTLSDANLSAILLHEAEANFLPRLKCGLLSDSYETLDRFIDTAKEEFTGERTEQAILPESQPEDETKNDSVLEEYEHNPNIRLVVRCTHDGKKEMIPLPLNDPQLSAVFTKLDNYGENAYSFGIEAIRYRGSWPGRFAKVLQDEGLFALNLLTASFPAMEEVNKLEAVVEYVEAHAGMNVDDSKTIIALADHLDDFNFYPGCMDTEDVGREYIFQSQYLQLSSELEEYFDYTSYGDDLQDEHQGEFVNGGYVFMEGMMRLEDVLRDCENMELQ